MKVKSFYDGSSSDDFEVLRGSSETIPDQSLSVRDILMRFTRGQMDLPPIEQGDDEDIDYQGDDFDDLVDAQDSYLNGVDLSSRLQNVQNRTNSDSSSSSDESDVPEKLTNSVDSD